jgi:HAMP domain-containing protein
MFTSLRGRLILLLLIAAVPAFALMIFSSFEWREQDAKLVRENTLRLSAFVANNLDRDFLEVRSYLHNVTNYPGVLEKDKAVCSRLFKSMIEQSPLYLNIGLFDTNGNLVASSREIEEGEKIHSAAWFREALSGKPFAVSSHYIYPGNVSSVHAAIPVVRNGVVDGALFLSLGTAWISELAREANLPEGAALTVTDKNGAVIARYPDPEKYLGTIQKWGANGEGTNASMAGFLNAVGLDGVERSYAYHLLDQAPISVRIGMPRPAVYKAANRVMYRNLAILGATTALSLFLAWYGAHILLLRPVRELVAATQKVAKGDLRARVDLPETGELGQLGASFNAMTESLEWRDAQLREADLGYRQILSQIDEPNSTSANSKNIKRQGESGADDTVKQ